MARKHCTTPKNLSTVMLRLNAYVANLMLEPEAQREFCADLDRFLNDLADQDAFGTEGQCDPRGDQRD